ncbi:hypothetical protein PM10SUCC1_31880 [Propionigenium maris DSM 9537]|uniref:Uncharacterized protein n=1 Tax=Propionigenium maris DSM 9537 TaxID=1123000 RepID=A0A9W6GPI1_9FUSO|nr:hypothetical protein [Propionigenium maris]GLI57674.1 hypothetical protein PM10SUCC1_31880 [Propionigenium maris DSM 9537]
MKKKGSALVFSVLMLSFFLALSLNIFFQARKKAERAGVKVQGERTTNNIDIASSLGYQELQLAEKLVREGIVYDESHPNKNDSYTLPATGSYLYIDPATGDFNSGKRYAGIQINNFIDYFSSSWDPGGTLSQKLIMGERISDGRVVSRMWQSAGTGSTLIPLWDSGSTSIGGYSLKTAPDFENDLDATKPGLQAAALYEKFIFLDNFTVKIREGRPDEEVLEDLQSVFRLEVTEEFDYVDSGTNITISNRQITSFIIEALD